MGEASEMPSATAVVLDDSGAPILISSLPNAAVDVTFSSSAASSTASSASPADAADTGSKKRRSRWAQAADESATADASSSASGDAASRAKRSRWGERDASAAAASPSPAPAAVTAASIAAQLTQALFTPEQLEQYKLQTRIDELTRYLLAPSSYPDDASHPRSPSPEPTYDSHGVRTNTREQRLKARLSSERNELILQLTALSPSYRPPSDWRRQTKFERRCYIPVKEFPGYNFIGLIIGPRGSTQKKMEKETGCKVVIRGRGSSKEGRTAKKAHEESDNDDIHVLISGDSQERADSTAAIIEKLLIPIDEALNEHKSKQLRELALINGTLRDDVTCRVCGARGHKLYECPERQGAAWKPADVRCDWCGETSHVSADCTRRANSGGPSAVPGRAQDELNAEYANFMSEITGGALTQRGIVGLITGQEEKDNGEAAAPHQSVGDRALNGGGSGQLMLTDGVERRGNPNVVRVGDGIVRRIVSNDPKEHAREYRPLNPPPPHAGGGDGPPRVHGPPPSSTAYPPQRFPGPPGYPPMRPLYPPYYPPPPPPPHYGYGYPPPGAAYPPPVGAGGYHPPPPYPAPPGPLPGAPSAQPQPLPPPSSPPAPATAAAPSTPIVASSAPPTTAAFPASQSQSSSLAAAPSPPPAPARPPGVNKFASWPPPADFGVH